MKSPPKSFVSFERQFTFVSEECSPELSSALLLVQRLLGVGSERMTAQGRVRVHLVGRSFAPQFLPKAPNYESKPFPPSSINGENVSTFASQRSMYTPVSFLGGAVLTAREASALLFVTCGAIFVSDLHA